MASTSAAHGDNLDEVERLVRKKPTTARVPLAWRLERLYFAGTITTPLFTVEPGRMELGLGVHGEPGIQYQPHAPGQREVADLLLDTLLADAPPGAGAPIAVLLNGLDNTKYEELFVLYKDVQRRLLAPEGLHPYKPIVNEMVT